MKSTGLHWTGFIFLSAATTASGYYFNNELKRIEAIKIEPVAQLAPVEINQDQDTIKDELILAMVDERLAVMQKQQSLKSLLSLKDQYQLAPAETVDNSLLYGDSNARITIKEYGDVECPYCRKMHAEVKRIVDHSEGVINWEFKHFPLAGHNPAAALEAQAIECVKEAYGNRVAWVAMDRMITETAGNGKGINDMTAFIRSFGLNGSLISNCLASDDHKDTINNDYAEGRNSGVSATPALVIVDNKTNKEYLIKGFKTSEMLLQAIQKIVQS